MSETTPLQDLLSRNWNMGLSFRAYLDYSQKNVERMRDVYERTAVEDHLRDAIKGLGPEIRLLVLSGDWCGDCVANVPPIARLADLNLKIQYRILDRDRHDDLMQEFLTNGARSVPKVVVASGDMAKVATWGARPAECQAIMDQNKGKLPKEEIVPMIRAWYEKDNGRTLLKEIWALISGLTPS